MVRTRINQKNLMIRVITHPFPNSPCVQWISTINNLSELTEDMTIFPDLPPRTVFVPDKPKISKEQYESIQKEINSWKLYDISCLYGCLEKGLLRDEFNIDNIHDLIIQMFDEDKNFLQLDIFPKLVEESTLPSKIQELLIKYPNEVAKYKAGKLNLFGFFMGKIMSEIKNGSPEQIKDLLRQELDKEI